MHPGFLLSPSPPLPQTDRPVIVAVVSPASPALACWARMLSDSNIHLSKLPTRNKIQVGYVPLKLIYCLKKTSYGGPVKGKPERC